VEWPKLGTGVCHISKVLGAAIFCLPRRRRSGGFDIRHLLNGLVDGYLYYLGRMDTTLPFDELRRRSPINEAAQAADGSADFSERIRASLPTISR
jgi:hypothetical protein